MTGPSVRVLAQQPQEVPERAGHLAHQEPQCDPDELLAEAVEAAHAADAAVVVVATTDRVESEGFDRADLRLPGRQDDLAGFASVEAAPGERAEAVVDLPRRASEVWDEAAHEWLFVKGSYEIQVGRSIADRRITAMINV